MPEPEIIHVLSKFDYGGSRQVDISKWTKTPWVINDKTGEQSRTLTRPDGYRMYDYLRPEGKHELIEAGPEKKPDLPKDEVILTKHDALKKAMKEEMSWLQRAHSITQVFPVYYDRSGLWWLWNDARKCYEITDETDIANIVDEAVKMNTLKGGVKSEMMEAFKRVGRKKKPLDIPASWVQFKDKIVDVTTLEEIDPNPGYFLTNPIPHNLGSSESTPKIDALLNEWAGEYALTLKQLIAYCTLRDYPIHRIFLLIGSGSNGKGTYLRMMNCFLGNENIASVEMDLIVTNQFHVTKLHNRLVAQMSETNFGTLKNTSMLKKLSGGDLIGFEYKNKLPFDMYNYAKIVIATNSLPATHDKTDGFYRRWVIIEFQQQFSEKRDVLKEIPEEEYENLCRWSARELKQLLEDRAFHNEGTIQDRKTKYESKSNPLLSFIAAHYMADPNDQTPAGEFFENFTDYLKGQGMRTLNYSTVRTMMKDEGYEYDRHRFPLTGQNPVASIVGLKRKSVSVSNVSEVSAIPSYPLYTKNQGVSGHTADTTDTKVLKYEDLASFFLEHPENNANELEDRAGCDAVDRWRNAGLIIELPSGTFRLV